MKKEEIDKEERKWVRGVNIGGWLVQERYLSPYQFALTECHIEGNLCWYPGQLGAPRNAPICDLSKCKPLRWNPDYPDMDFPKDESTLTTAFKNTTYAENWFNAHFDNFLKKEDLQRIKDAGLTHVRVPLPHWILGDISESEVWIMANRWDYFKRMVQWCRAIGLEVWPNIHTAPGSQNGFDNSGIARSHATCYGWDDTAYNVQRSLDVVHQVTRKIVEESMDDVVTGFGILNEPFFDCHFELYRKFANDAVNIVRGNMGSDVYVFVSDMFHAEAFNDGWWLDSRYNHTLLDSHYYHVFKPAFREMSPRQHIGFACLPEPKNDGLTSCCYQDFPNNTIPSKGVQRIVTEWSAAFDKNPGPLLEMIMINIAINGTAPFFDRNLPEKRQAFLENFIKAQIVAYEAREIGFSKGWFFWTLKTEGGAFAEWDFLRSFKEGWFPKIAPRNVSSEELYGSCRDILLQTDDDLSIIDEFPPPSDDNDDAIVFDDDLVVTHGNSLLSNQTKVVATNIDTNTRMHWMLPLLLSIVALVFWILNRARNKRATYSHVNDVEGKHLVV